MKINKSTIEYVCNHMVTRCHVSESNLSIIRYVKSRFNTGIWDKLENRKELMKAIIKKGMKNRDLYNFVMGSH